MSRLLPDDTAARAGVPARPYTWLAGGFVVCLVVSNILAAKLVAVGPLIVPAAVILYPLTFLLDDLINEFYGPHVARHIVRVGFALQVGVVLAILAAIGLPAAPVWHGQAAYSAVLGTVPRIAVASLLAFLLGEYTAISIFAAVRRRTGRRRRWLRSNASDLLGELVDTGCFIGVAFAGTVPPHVLLTLFASQYAVKAVYSVLETIPFYVVTDAVRRQGTSGSGAEATRA